jgi:hypothetical protein
MDLGADIDLPDVFGNTPLHYAAAWGHLPVRAIISRPAAFRRDSAEADSPSSAPTGRPTSHHCRLPILIEEQ